MKRTLLISALFSTAAFAGERIIAVKAYSGEYLATAYPQNNVPQSLYLAGGGSAVWPRTL